MYQVDALVVGTHLAAGDAVVPFRDGRRQLSVDQKSTADTEVDLEGTCIQFDRGRGRLERLFRQASDDDGRRALDVAITPAYTDPGKIADNEVDRFGVAFGSEQVGEERQHVAELPAGEAVVGLVQRRIAEVFRMQSVAARDGTAELLRRLLSAGNRHVTGILQAARVRAPFVIARTPPASGLSAGSDLLAGARRCVPAGACAKLSQDGQSADTLSRRREYRIGERGRR